MNDKKNDGPFTPRITKKMLERKEEIRIKIIEKYLNKLDKCCRIGMEDIGSKSYYWGELNRKRAGGILKQLLTEVEKKPRRMSSSGSASKYLRG